MKVIFSGVPDRIIANIKESIADALPNHQYYDAEGRAQFFQHVNTNQSVTVKGTTVTVEGERCALWGDHNAGAMARLMASGIKPSEYHTSDSRLEWHETLAGYMEGPRATFDEALRYCREKKVNPSYCLILKGAHQDAERLKVYPLRASAEMSAERLQRAREVIALHEKQGE